MACPQRDRIKTEERKFIGLMTDLVLIHETEEEQDQAMMDLALEWSKKGYTICSGNVLEGKVNEIWAIKNGIDG